MNVWMLVLVQRASSVQILKALTIVPAQLVTLVMEIVAYVSSWIVYTQHYLNYLLVILNILFIYW